MISGSKTKDKNYEGTVTRIPRKNSALSRNCSFERKKNQGTLLYNVPSNLIQAVTFALCIRKVPGHELS
jgi:hypothetical protein